MASPVDSRIVTPIITSLSRSSLIKIAVQLWKDVGVQSLDNAFNWMQLGGSMNIYGNSDDPIVIRMFRGHKTLLHIPALLRKRLIESVRGLECAMWEWEYENKDIPKLRDEKHIFYWRADGSIDRIKTAQRLVLNANIDIRKRFDIACKYCLDESIHTLWKEMETSGETENFKTSFDPMVSFWVRRIRDDSQVSWPQAALEYLDSLRMRPIVPNLACCRSIFPLLQPEDRKKFLFYFQFGNPDDIRLCLYTMDKEEQKQILKTCAVKVLCQYFELPLLSVFLETAQKIFNYIDETSFCDLMQCILLRKGFLDFFLDFDDSIVEDLWNMGPDCFRERARKFIRNDIDSFLNEIKKRKAADEMNEQILKKVCSDTDRKK